MHPPLLPDSAFTRPRPWIGVGLVVLAAVLVASYARRAEDFAGYVLVGELALQGRDIYRDAPPGISTWPPLFSLLCVPLALLTRISAWGARAFWLALNMAALAATLALVLRLVSRGPRDTQRDAPVPALSSLMALSVLTLTSRYVISNFEHLQVNVLIFLLALGGLALLSRGRTLPGALALGAAGALKVMPALFVVYLAWRRRWRDAAWTAAAGIVLTLSPALVYGPTRLLDYFRGWASALDAGWNVGKMNLSVFAMWDRIVGHGLVPFAVAGFDSLPRSGSPTVAALLALSLLLAAGLAWWSFRAGNADDPRAELAEWSVVFLIAALFGTVAWKAYLMVLLLPNALLLAVWQDPDAEPALRRLSMGAVLSAFVLGVLTTDGVWGRGLAGRLEMGSIVTAAALAMLGGLYWFRRRSADLPSAGGS
jgi:alpha-1,2-mannosyltransferase